MVSLLLLAAGASILHVRTRLQGCSVILDFEHFRCTVTDRGPGHAPPLEPLKVRIACSCCVSIGLRVLKRPQLTYS
ncbi:hypothetical protein BAUCODRAFT_38913 [Baudoinia panamericana UAMH 10762]|uniref:Secreted protein n=1 Tax=Baudoinia panamericana (strain UAMH 10762) TaxID=717646 RepID=M2MKB8_BAUPA|nr:uncharacterized protein BAUCODRAFT_38913 [Baudoinia panamericana UAMH 10762]EMC91773.1 hypothetical protein BAUCODRAFT_38913 [Baudoinia panamericana UAMH 10762]